MNKHYNRLCTRSQFITQAMITTTKAAAACLTLSLCVNSGFGQQAQWSLSGQDVDYNLSSAAALPNSTVADNIQNAQWDQGGNLLFYVADGIIYNKNGASMIEPAGFCNYEPSKLGYSEAVITPIPGECDKYFVIFTYADGFVNEPDELLLQSGGATGWHLIYWAVDMNLNNGMGGVTTPNNQAATPCGYYDLKLDDNAGAEAKSENIQFHTQNLLGVTKANTEGERKLFATAFGKLNLINITSSGLTLNRSYDVNSHHSLRGELEVIDGLKGNQFVVAYPWVKYSSIYPQDQTYAGIDFIHIDKSTLNMTDQYYWVIRDELAQNLHFLAKGLEFSKNREYLFFTQVEIDMNWSDGTGVLNQQGNTTAGNLNYISFNALNNRYENGLFTIHNHSGEERELAFGQIELGDDDALYVASNNSLSRLANSNNPQSTFTFAYATPSLSLTKRHTAYLPTNKWYFGEAMYLLVDQHDLENLAQPRLDLWPNKIFACTPPYTFPSYHVLDWQVQNLNTGQIDYILNQASINVFFDSRVIGVREVNGCYYYDTTTVLFDPIAIHESNFSWQFTNNGSSVDLSVNSPIPPGYVAHSWVLEEWDGANWIAITTGWSNSNTQTITGLTPFTDYRVTHTITPLEGTSCPFQPTTSKTFYSGGKQQPSGNTADIL